MRLKALTVFILAVAALSSAAEPDSPIVRGEIPTLKRSRRWAASAACTNVVECLGTLTLILPLRYLLDLELIYDRLTGVDGYTNEEWLAMERLRSMMRHRELKVDLMRRAEAARRRLIAARLRSMQKEAEEVRERLKNGSSGAADRVKF